MNDYSPITTSRITQWDDFRRRWQINNDHGDVAIDELGYVIGKAVDKLAEYEDAGFTPPEFTRIHETLLTVQEKHREMWNYLQKYLQADAEGRLFELPFKVGDEIWSGEPFKDKQPRMGHVVAIEFDEYGFCGFWASFGKHPISAEFIKEDIGKTVFFSREMAESAARSEQDA